jgi:hypothetical protein
MSTETVEPVVPVGAAPSRAALDRVRRYLYEELGPQRGPGGVGLTRARALFRAPFPSDVDRSPSSAARLAAQETAAATPVVVSGSFHLLAVVAAGTTTP